MENSFGRRSASLLVLGLLLLGGSAQAADIKERAFKIAFVNVKEHPHGLGAQKFADILKEKSGGKMTARLYGGGTLGGDLAVVSSLQGGTLDMTMVVPGTLSGQIKEFSIFDFPLLFDDYKEADAVLDGPVGKRLLDRLPEKGLVGLGYWDHGYRNLTNNRHPVAKLEDIRGLKVRVIQIPIVVDAFSALGANPVPMPLPEVYTALETGAVDGQENPFALIEFSKYQEVQKYASTTRHIYNPLMVLFSRKTWDKLSEDERRIVMEAADEAKRYERTVSREENDKALEKLKKDGMEVTEFPPEEIGRMRETLRPVTEKYTREVGEALVQELHAEIRKVRDGQ